MQKASVSPTTVDLAWAAGFLEGEGCFIGGKSKADGTVSARFGIQVRQVDPEPLAKLLKFFGGTVSFCDAHRAKQSDYFTWDVSGERGRGVAMTLLPFLSKRRQDRIAEALHGVAAGGRR